jgi:hypothetical protein
MSAVPCAPSQDPWPCGVTVGLGVALAALPSGGARPGLGAVQRLGPRCCAPARVGWRWILSSGRNLEGMKGRGIGKKDNHDSQWDLLVWLLELL